jgi:hypothetical protein
LPRPLRRRRAARFVLVAVAALGLAFAAVLSVHEDVLPSWLPDKLGRLTIRAGDASELPVTRDEAIAYARTRLFVLADAGAEPKPDAIPIHVSGRVPPEQPVPLSSSGQVVFRYVEREPAWLVVWRGLDRGILSSPPTRTDDLMDAVFFIDDETGVLLSEAMFLSEPARLR